MATKAANASTSIEVPLTLEKVTRGYFVYRINSGVKSEGSTPFGVIYVPKSTFNSDPPFTLAGSALTLR
jgi:hypothetical protein